MFINKNNLPSQSSRKALIGAYLIARLWREWGSGILAGCGPADPSSILGSCPYQEEENGC